MSSELPQRVHVLGIGGVGMSGVALLLRDAGCLVTGSDLRESPIIERVRAAGCEVTMGPQPEAASQAEWLVIPDGVGEHHPERVAAVDAGVTTLLRGEALMRLVGERRVVAVIGTLGRSVGTLALWASLGGADAGVGYVCGALPSDGSPHARFGDPMIVELDARRALPVERLEGLLVTDVQAPSLGYYADATTLPEDVRASCATHDVHLVRPVPCAGAGVAWGMAGSAGPTLSALFGGWHGAEVGAGARSGLCTSTLLSVKGSSRSVTTPLGHVEAEAVAAAVAYAVLVEGRGLIDVVDALEANESAQVMGHFEGRGGGASAPVVHEVRTHPIAVHRALRSLMELTGVRSVVVIRPYPFTLGPQNEAHLVRALSDAASVVVLSPYPGGDGDADQRLVQALRRAGVVAEVGTEAEVRSFVPADAPVLCVGGEDMASLADVLTER